MLYSTFLAFLLVWIGGAQLNASPISASNATHLKVGDLSLDVLLLILDKLDLHELANIAETNRIFSHLASDVFRRKFSKKTIKIVSSSSIGSMMHIFNKNDNVEIQDYETVPKVLKYFGHLITSLKVEYYFVFDSEIENISRNINLYCSDTLMDLDVHSGHEDFFDDMKKPFKAVKSVSVRGRYNSLGSKTLKLNELYPEMINLTMKNIKVFDSSWINLNFPHLKYLCVDVSQNTDPRMAANYLSEADVDRFIKNNQQIESVRLGSITQNLLKMVAKDLPNLVNLELECYDEWNSNFEHREIRFDNVKRFTMEGGSHSVPENIAFTQLEEFQTDGFPKECTRWIDLIENSKSLRKVHVYERYIKNSEFQRLAQAHSNLTEISLMCGKDVEDETIAMFIKNSKQLTKMYLGKYIAPNSGFSVDQRSLNSTSKVLHEKFGKEWIIYEHNLDIFFERKIY